MIAEFETYLRANTSMNDEDIELICSLAVERTLRRNELLLQQGQVCRHKIFIANGLLRTYDIAADGSERILQFSPENSWTLDVESYDRQTPALYNIAAVESSAVLLWKKPDFDGLVANLAEMKTHTQQLISRNIYLSRQRLSTALGGPEEKYEDFVRNYPHLLLRVPLRMIASYLGISLKTLTRIRHAQLHR